MNLSTKCQSSIIKQVWVLRSQPRRFVVQSLRSEYWARRLCVWKLRSYAPLNAAVRQTVFVIWWEHKLVLFWRSIHCLCTRRVCSYDEWTLNSWAQKTITAFSESKYKTKEWITALNIRQECVMNSCGIKFTLESEWKRAPSTGLGAPASLCVSPHNPERRTVNRVLWVRK